MCGQLFDKSEAYLPAIIIDQCRPDLMHRRKKMIQSEKSRNESLIVLLKPSETIELLSVTGACKYFVSNETSFEFLRQVCP